MLDFLVSDIRIKSLTSAVWYLHIINFAVKTFIHFHVITTMVLKICKDVCRIYTVDVMVLSFSNLLISEQQMLAIQITKKVHFTSSLFILVYFTSN